MTIPLPSYMAPRTLYRIGSSVLSSTVTFETSKNVCERILTFPVPMGTSYTTSCGVWWEVWAKGQEDMLELLWNGQISMIFTSSEVPLGPLSQTLGLPHMKSVDQVERLWSWIQTAEWREKVGFVGLEQNPWFFRGYVPLEMPCCWPSGCNCTFKFTMTPVELAHPVRVRLVLPIKAQSTIDMS